jgi:hypothetical protein
MLQEPTLESENIFRTTILFFCFPLKSFACHKLTILLKLRKSLC